jgi:hypothetical protein
MRVVIAAFVGGFLMFMCGAFCHMFLEIESRNIQQVANEEQLHDFLVQQGYAPGMYGYPSMPAHAKSATKDEQNKIMEEVWAKFKAGPACYLIIPPSGEEPMGATQLGGELCANIIAAFSAALIANCISSSIGRFGRWLLIVAIAPCSWFSLTCSFALWYRFPWPFVLDGLVGAVIEWAVAGLAIVWILKIDRTTIAGRGK